MRKEIFIKNNNKIPSSKLSTSAKPLLHAIIIKGSVDFNSGSKSLKSQIITCSCLFPSSSPLIKCKLSNTFRIPPKHLVIKHCANKKMLLPKRK